VYDNLGVETAWKRFYCIKSKFIQIPYLQDMIVSDAAAGITTEEPRLNVISQLIRQADIIDFQVRVLRKRQIVLSLQEHDRCGAYFSIRGDLKAVPTEWSRRLAHIPTRFNKMSQHDANNLVLWGSKKCKYVIDTYCPTLKYLK
jgi:hypothetical protein